MTAVQLLLVAVTGAIGAVVRFELTDDRPVTALHAVNVVGSLLLGLFAGSGAGGTSVAFSLAGGLGAVTSFSTWMVGARTAARQAPVPGLAFAGHLLLPTVLAVGGAWVGIAIGSSAQLSLAAGPVVPLLGGAR